ncbi:MAG: hypothetical protein JSV36_14290 [Anaerolineae bacterium]|nr:MAG: hypothetical protein JSV36_14290 [Anaerolineae bacterium]
MEQSRVYLDKTVRQLEMLRREQRNLLVVSDLHLSEGFDEAEGLWSINEDFFFDDQFARCLQFAQRQRARYGGAPWRLILNGDIFDFRQVIVPRDDQVKQEIREKRLLEKRRTSATTEPAPSEEVYHLSLTEKNYGPGTSRVMSSWRVDRVYQGHKGFFQVLAWFVACGNELVFIKGNHDIELHWLKVQMGIKRQLCEAYEAAQDGGLYDLDWQGLPNALGRAELDRVYFLPWNYYEPKRVYIEHGQQFHSTDSEAYILWPVLPPEENELELTLGDLFGRYFVNKLEELFPLMDNMKPFSKGMQWVLNKGIPSRLREGNLSGDLVELWAQLWNALRGARLIFEKNRAELVEFGQQRQDELKEYGDHAGLGADCALELEALKSPPQLRSKRLIWRWLAVRALEVFGVLLLLLAVVIALSAAVLVGAGVAFLGLKKAMMIYSAIGWVGAAVTRGLKLKMQRPDETLAKKALEMHRVLHRHGKDVKYVFMGHDHNAAFQRLDAALSREYGLSVEDCFYVNSGTWTAVIVHDQELVPNATQFAFIRLVGDTAHLMRWNDAGGSWEPIVLH